jgi:hypothetical protein
MTDAPHPQTYTRSIGAEQLALYRIEVQGSIGTGWAAWFEGTVIEQRADSIILEALIDQAALRGLLCRLWDLNLSVMSVHRMEADARATGGTPND